MRIKLTHSILLALLLLPLATNAATLYGQVVGVSDGDTITVLDSDKRQHKIRLEGIDAPEKAQAFGQVSKQALSDLVFDNRVIVEWSKEDRYKRLVGKVILSGTDINLKQTTAGLAWHYKKYSNEQTKADALLYASAENAARSRGLGLWADPHAVPPWDWRKQKKKRAGTLP